MVTAVINGSQETAYIFYELIRHTENESGRFDTQFEGWGETDLSNQFSNFQFNRIMSFDAEKIKKEPEAGILAYTRDFFEYVQVIDYEVSIFRITNPFATLVLHDILATEIDNMKEVQYQNGKVVHSKIYGQKLIGNFVSIDDSKRLKVILDIALTQSGEVDDLIIPTENRLIGIRQNTIVAIVANCGYQSFNYQRDKIRKRRSAETDFIIDTTSFQWQSNVDSNIFEDFILELLRQLPEVRWVRKVGEGNEPDQGRDLIAEWLLSPTPCQRVTDEKPIRPQRIIIQCKAYKKNVGKSSVTDVRDTIDFHEADGYLLVAYPGITRPLLDYLNSQRQRGLFWFDWWTRTEIEDLLRNNIEFVKRFPEIVTIANSV